MKAAVIYRYGEPDVFQIEQVASPVIKNQEVLIRVKAASINPVDWKQRQGNHRVFLRAKWPVILGYDVAGEITECGRKVKRFKPGDQVYARLDRRFGGAYAEYAATSESTLSLKPHSVSFNQAAAVPLAGITALQALRDKGKIKPGCAVLIIGAAGGVGHFALQLAKEFKAHITAVCSSKHEKMIGEIGPDRFIDYTVTDYKKEKTKYDIVFDAAGVESYLTCKGILTQKGVYITTLPRPKLLIHKLISVFNPGKVKTLLMRSKGSDLDFISGLIEKGQFKAYIDSVFTLEQIAEAHRHAEEYKTEGKIVIQVAN